MRDRLKVSLEKHYKDSKADVQSKVPLLFYLHASLMLFLVITSVLVLFLTPQANGLFYLLLVLISLAIVCIANGFNLNGHYDLSLKVTIMVMFIAPWVSIVYESCMGSGDFMPMIYVIIPIQIAALFLAAKSVLLISGIQTVAIIANITLYHTQHDYNWVSVVCYVFIASLLGSVTSYLIRTQYDKLLVSKEELARNQEKLRDISIHDALSGVYNRRYMDEILDLLTRNPEQHFAILMLDIDHFKNINDQCGHSKGDFVIQTVAKILTSVTRKNDIVCRYGGDEFMIILDGCISGDAFNKASEIMRQVGEIGCACEDAEALLITASIGIALYPDHGKDQGTLLRAVDMALYRAKQGGRNRIQSA